MKRSVDAAYEELTSFLACAGEPALVEPGHEPIPLVAGAYHVERLGEKLFVEAWTRDRTLSRRLTGLIATSRYKSQFSTERFGKKEGTLDLIDLRAPRAEDNMRRATRQTYREQFRRSLLRQFPGWRVAELSTEPDLENSLSPAYSRALLRKGTAGFAAIGCSAGTQDVDGVLTFGLIWLDYIRRRDPKLKVVGLAVFVPEGQHRSVCLKMLHLRSGTTEWAAFVFADRIEDRVDLRDYGNVDTELPVCRRVANAEQEAWLQRLSGIHGVTWQLEHDASVSWTVRGLEFARWSEGKGFVFGIDSKRKGTVANASEVESIARELARFRSNDGGDPLNPLYLRKPELWLENQVRLHIRDIDASLESEPVYRQAPALTSGERGVLDLVGTDYSGRLAVVEVKVTEDIHLPLQALDYWIRVNWHAKRDHFRLSGYFPGRSLQTVAPRLLLVAPALHFHPTTEALIRHFSAEVEVDTIGLATDWRESIRVMFRSRRQMRP